MSNMIVKCLPNSISCIRVVLGVLLLHYNTWVDNTNIVIILITVAAFSDYLDGAAARYFHCETTLGKILDPCADAMFLAALVYVLWQRNALSTVCMTWIYMRYITIWVLQTRLFTKYNLKVQALPSGKYSIVATMVWLLCVVTTLHASYISKATLHLFNAFTTWVMLMMIMSLVDYVANYYDKTKSVVTQIS